MREWTEQEEQEMIERAKAGEPEANYELSLWALARSEEEPDEPRWNRLAAKCLVKAAQAGYGPAQKQMAALLKTADEPTPAPSQPEEDQPPRREAPKAPPKAAEREPVSIRQARQSHTKGPTATARRPVRPAPEQDEPEDDQEAPEAEDAPVTAGRHSAPAKRSAPARRKSAPRRAARPAPEEDEPEDDQDELPADEPLEDGDEDREEAVKARPARRPKRSADKDKGKKKSGGLFADWGDAQWRRLEFICVAICVVLLVAIAVMLLTGRHGGGENGAAPTVPPAGEAAPAAATDAPISTPEGFPDSATREAIQAAELDIPPAEEDYRDGPTTATVSVNSVSLRLRKGPNTSYSEITSMPDGSKVEVFADKNDWSLVRYQGEESPIYGWCSSSYLIIDATPVAIG